MSPAHRPDLPDRDPALDAAWKAQSTELPPSHLDAAILAAAHREARTRPQATGEDEGVAHARGPSRAWWGLAAAATIGAIAFGTLQLAPLPGTVKDQSATVATDIPSPAPERAPSAAASRDAPAVPGEAQPLADALPSAAAPREDERRAVRTRAPDPTPSAASRPNAQKAQESKQRRADALAERQRESAVEAAAPPARALAEAPAAASAPGSPEVTAMAPRPIPGAAPVPSVAVAPASPPAPTPPAALAKTEAAGNAADARRGQSGEQMAAAAPTPPVAQTGRRAQVDAAAPGVAADAVGKLQARTPVAWIERIRALQAERRYDDAARELNAFRDAYPDADTRLPAELKAWATSVKRN